MKKLLIIILFICSLQNLFAGNNIYVSEFGNDGTGNGTFGNPYATLPKGISVAVSGDSIQVLSGGYTLTTILDVPIGISIIGQDSATVIIVSSYSGTNKDQAAIRLQSADETAGNQVIKNITLSGSLTAWAGILVMGRSNVTVQHCFIYNFYATGIYFSGANSGIRPSIYAHGNILEYCTIQNCADRTAINNWGNVAVSGFKPLSGGDTGMIIRNCIIRQTERALGQNGNNFTIPAGDSSSVEGLKFYNNKSYRNPDDVGADWSFHMEIWDCQGGMEIFNNEFYGGNQQIDLAGTDTSYRSFGLHGNYTYNFYIHNNLFQIDTPFPSATTLLVLGVDIEADKSDIIIRNNHFVNIPYAVQTSLNHAGAKGQRRIQIDYNLIEHGGFDNGNFCFDFSIIGSNQAALVRDYSVDNNTFANTRTRAACYITLGSLDSLINFSFSNNIVTGVPATGYGAITFSESTGLKDSINMKNNIIYNCTNSNNIFYRNGAIPPINFDNAGTQKTDPIFNGDFTLKVTSPAIGAGTNGQDVGALGVMDYPIINVGSDTTTSLTTITLLGSLVSDPTDIATITWIKISGTGTQTILNNTTLTPTITGLVSGQYVFRMTAQDSDAGKHEDIIVNVTGISPQQPFVKAQGRIIFININ